MKRTIILFFILIINIFGENIPSEVELEINNWIEETHSFNKIIEFEKKKEEINSYIWFRKNKLDLDVLTEIQKKYPKEKLGYTLQKSMYEIDLKKKNTEKENMLPEAE